MRRNRNAREQVRPPQLSMGERPLTLPVQLASPPPPEVRQAVDLNTLFGGRVRITRRGER